MTNPQHEALVEAVARLRGLVATLHYEGLGFARHEGSPFDLAMTRAEAEFGNLHAIAALSATAAAPSDEVVRERYQHVKRGTLYEVIGTASLQIATGDLVDGSDLIIYRGEDGKLWARETGEFHDGRFARAALEPQGKDL